MLDTPISRQLTIYITEHANIKSSVMTSVYMRICVWYLLLYLLVLFDVYVVLLAMNQIAPWG